METEPEPEVAKLIVGTDGQLYVRKPVGPSDRPLFEAVLKAPSSMLPSVGVKGPELKLLNLPKLTLADIVLTRLYFSAVYKKHKSEAIVIFHRNVRDTSYTIVVPESYSASGGHVQYEPMQIKFCDVCRICTTEAELEKCPHCLGEAFTDLNAMGTAHSHGAMGAFHSGTDDEHEMNQTGFHITFGHVDTLLVDICPSFVVALCGFTDAKGKGKRFRPTFEELIELPLEQEDTARAEAWTGLVVSAKKLFEAEKTNAVVLGENGELLLIENNPGEAKQWCSVQPSDRELRTITVSEYRAALQAAKQKSASTYGSRPTSSSPTRQITAAATTTASTKVDPKVTQLGRTTKPTTGLSDTTQGWVALSPTPGKQGAINLSTIDLHFGEEPGEFIVKVENRAITTNADKLLCFDTKTSEELTLWENFFNELAPEIRSHAFLYAMECMIPQIDEAANVFLHDDGLLQEFADIQEILIEIFGNAYTFPKDHLENFVMDATDARSPADVIDSYLEHIVNQQVPLEAIPTDSTQDGARDLEIVAIFGSVYTLWALQELLDTAIHHKVLTDDTVTTLNASIENTLIKVCARLKLDDLFDPANTVENAKVTT